MVLCLESQEYYANYSNIIILKTRKSQKKIRGEVSLEFFPRQIPSSEASSIPAGHKTSTKKTVKNTSKVRPN